MGDIPRSHKMTYDDIDVTKGSITVALIDGNLKLREEKCETCDEKVHFHLEHLGCEIEMVQSISGELELKLVQMETCTIFVRALLENS